MQDEVKQSPHSKRRVICWLFLSLLFSVFVSLLYIQHQKLQVTVMQLGTELEHQRSEIQHQKQIVSELQAKDHVYGRLLEKIHHWLEMANFQLVISRNIPGTIRLLQAAEQAIQSANAPALLALQKAVRKDIIALQAAPDINFESLVLRIDKIGEEIEGLPVISSQVKSSETALSNTKSTTQVSSSIESVWKRFLVAVMQTLHESIIIRHHTLPLEPLLPPKEKAYLVANIRCQLSQASWAALHSQPLLYEHAIAQASQWIRQYYRDDLAPVENILQHLDSLQKINIKPTMPDITDALKELDGLASL